MQLEYCTPELAVWPLESEIISSSQWSALNLAYPSAIS